MAAQYRLSGALLPILTLLPIYQWRFAFADPQAAADIQSNFPIFAQATAGDLSILRLPSTGLKQATSHHTSRRPRNSR